MTLETEDELLSLKARLTTQKMQTASALYALMFAFKW